MTIAKIGKKFPWKTLVLGIFCALLIISLVGIIWLGVDGFLALVAGLTIGFFTLIGGVAWACITNLYFWAGFGIMGVVFFIYFYRKNYAKQKVLIPSTSPVSTGYDTLSKPLFDDETKVESA
jgi:hypothetical protein